MKPRRNKMVECPECGGIFSTRCNTPSVWCPPCRKSREYKKNMHSYSWRLNKLLAAAKKSLPFDLDLDYLINLWHNSKGACEITHWKFDLGAYGDKGQVNPRAPSIDRITPAKGYTKDNVRLVCYHVNVALSEYGDEHLKVLAKAIIEGEA